MSLRLTRDLYAQERPRTHTHVYLMTIRSSFPWAWEMQALRGSLLLITVPTWETRSWPAGSGMAM